MKKPIATDVLFTIIWRSWTLGVLLFAVPVSLIGVPAMLASGGVQVLGQFSLVLLFVPLAAAIQGAILGALICLGYVILPAEWLGFSGADREIEG